jgi:hypothetical protein
MCMCMCICDPQHLTMRACIEHINIKLIAFELAAKFSRRRENPVQPRLCNAKNAIFKRLKTGVSLRSRSSPANSNAISFTSFTCIMHVYLKCVQVLSISTYNMHVHVWCMYTFGCLLDYNVGTSTRLKSIKNNKVWVQVSELRKSEFGLLLNPRITNTMYMCGSSNRKGNVCYVFVNEKYVTYIKIFMYVNIFVLKWSGDVCLHVCVCVCARARSTSK